MATNDLPCSFQLLSDTALLAETKRLAARERDATVDVIAALMEIDARKLYLGEGYSSLFAYCTQGLHLSEHAAYGRIEAARTARRVPDILDAVADGSLTLTTVGLLAPHLNAENQSELIEATRHKSKRDVERAIAAWRPLPAVPSSIRKLPAPTTPLAPPVAEPPRSTAGPTLDAGTGAPAAAPALVTADPSPKRAVVAPLAPERYKVQITISGQAHADLRRAQELLRHVIPTGDPALIVERALALLVSDLERKKLAAVKSPRSTRTAASRSRHVPAAVRRQVWTRDGGRCAFIGTDGRCTERGFLELHHVIPFADGGASDAANLQLRCRAHNAFEADAWFGPCATDGPCDSVRAGSGPS
jgi:hypothetical protein